MLPADPKHTRYKGSFPTENGRDFTYLIAIPDEIEDFRWRVYWASVNHSPGLKHIAYFYESWAFYEVTNKISQLVCKPGSCVIALDIEHDDLQIDTIFDIWLYKDKVVSIETNPKYEISKPKSKEYAHAH